MRLFVLSVLVLSLISGARAYAWHVEGQVRCPNGSVYPGVKVAVLGASSQGAFEGFDYTDSDGRYLVELPNAPGSFVATLDASTLPSDATIPAPVNFVTTYTAVIVTINWGVDSSVCEDGACWLTGGGAITSPRPVTSTARRQAKSKTGSRTPNLSFGGNINPGCSPTAGDGGNWNHVDRILNLHFQAKSIKVVRCGNVPGIPAG